MGRKRKLENRVDRKRYVRLVCTGCGERKTLHVNNPDIYTKEIRANYLCLRCKPRRRV